MTPTASTSSNDFHIPVLAGKCVEMLALRPGGVYVDATLGGGGHTKMMFAACPEITVYGFDQDSEALARVSDTMSSYLEKLHLVHANFSQMRTELALRKVGAIDGILFDLGVSSHQLDCAERGFSFDQEAVLDMRMNQAQQLTALEIVNTYSADELKRIIKNFGEELQAAKIARAIVSVRTGREIRTTRELANIVESVCGTGSRESLKSKVRVFQGLRIFVNSELEVLETALADAINLLKPCGRIIVLSYHSLEDRIVKNVFRNAEGACTCPPKVMKCVCGNQRKLRVLTKRPVTADEEEIRQNRRARSVRLRAAEKDRGNHES